MGNWFDRHLAEGHTVLRLIGYILRDWFVNILHGADIFLNCLFAGNRGETISGRAGHGKVRGSGFWTLIAFPIDLFFYLIGVDKKGDHCTLTAYEESYKKSLTSMTYDEFLSGRFHK